MPIAAVPAYLGNEFKDASPALRFGMYLKLWGINRRSNALLWTTHDLGYEVRGQDRREREVRYENKTEALKQATRLTDLDKAVNVSLVSRQSCGAAFLPPARLLRLDATAMAPFTTGLGNEHPLENGFAFLNPYGLPYLPGSGVKGVLRQAAQELASGEWGDTKGWSKDKCYTLAVGKESIPLSVIDVLFGLESQDGSQQHVRGALSFWDVIPQIADNSLMVEVMTPHQSHYYQQKKDRKSGDSVSPHDSGQPNPICFLTVPPDSRFTFHVVCDEQYLKRLTNEKMLNAPDLLTKNETHWKTLLHAAFQHAFQWLGFGAKTAVGYGAMQAVEPATSMPTSAQQEPATPTGPQPKPAAPSVQATEEQWTNATLTYQKGGGGMVTVTGSAGKKVEARGEQAQEVRKALSPEQAKRLEKKGSLTGLTVQITIEGNMRTVKAVLPERTPG